MTDPKHSPIYDLVARAMAERKRLVCSYNSRHRVICPYILGRTNGEETVLAYQVEGESSKGNPVNWKCLKLAKMTDVKLRDGDWPSESSHTQSQTCVQIVDLDVNPLSPYSPKRQLTSLLGRRKSPPRRG